MLPLSPRGWAVVGFFLALVATVLGAYACGTASGEAKAERRALALAQKQDAALREAEARNREQEKAHEQAIAQLRADYARSDAEARAADARVIADLRAGTQRLRLAVTSCSSTQAGTSVPAPAGADGAGTADLTPEASETLWSIASDGDRAIRKLSALQDWAMSAVRLCGESK